MEDRFLFKGQRADGKGWVVGKLSYRGNLNHP